MTAIFSRGTLTQRWLAGRTVRTAFAAIALLVAGERAALSEDSWNPFADKDRRAAERTERRRGQPTAEQPPGPRGPYLAPMTGPDVSGNRNDVPQPYPATPPGYASGAPYGAPGTYMPAPEPGASGFNAAEPGIERGDLTPVISSKGALTAGIWQGLDASAAEQLLGPVRLPPASPALSDLLDRILADPIADPNLNSVRVAALLKAGRFTVAALEGQTPGRQNSAAAQIAAPQIAAPGSASDIVRDILATRLELATDRTEPGCARIKGVVAAQNTLPKHLRGEAIVLAGYCAIVAGNQQAGALAAELAREAGYNRPFTLAILEAIASGGAVRAPLPAMVTLTDGLLIGKLRTPDPALIEAMLARADAGFLQRVATDTKSPPTARLIAAERAAAANVTGPAALADAWRAAAGATGTAANAALDRARQFAEAERQQSQFAKTRAIRALLDSAKGDGLYHPAAVAVAPIVRALRPAQEISWFTETAVEALAAGGDYRTAREWIRSGPPSGGTADGLDHWLMLLDIADPEVDDRNRGRSIAVLENLALRGRFSQPALHRLATVLDALDYNIPIPLWNLASRTEQPQTGHLPQTGILSAMKQASEARQIAATTLYALHTIAPAGTSATHLLGLGDTLRALKRAGLEKDARRLGFEALFGDWPRTVR